MESSRRRTTSRRRPPRLSRDAIVDVALHLVDTEGVDAVSMRRVAAEFDTGPASLYAHVANKQALLQLVLERVVEEADIPEGDDWQEVLRGWAHNARAVFQRHSDVARLSFAHIPSNERTLQVIERLLAVMHEGGVPDQVAAWSTDILALFIAADAYEGWLLGKRFDDGSGRDPEEVGAEVFATELAPLFNAPPEAYPHLTRMLPTLTGGSSDERFAFGIDMLIAGFAAQVPKRRRR